MRKTKLKLHKNLSVDMAGLCDVAFLLLVFFVASSRFKPWEPVNINIPHYTNNINDPDSDPATVFISKDKIMLEIPNEQLRSQVLAKMATRYGLSFTAAELAKFNTIDIIGTPVNQLKQYINTYYDQSSFFSQTGIPYDHADNELAYWILYTRETCKSLFVIKADKAVPYPKIERVMDIFQRQHINKFSLLASSGNFQ